MICFMMSLEKQKKDLKSFDPIGYQFAPKRMKKAGNPAYLAKYFSLMMSTGMSCPVHSLNEAAP